MKKLIGILGVVVLFNVAGCATQGYVSSQVDPLADRLTKLESKVSQLNELTEADKAAINQANAKAQQALDAASKMAGDVKLANNDVKKAEAAALRAENAARDAELAAKESQQMEKKSEKIFKLEQKK
jgi:outer membrane murein-binding lipoprotein Lpp